MASKQGWAIFLTGSFTLLSAVSRGQLPTDPLDYIDPTIGNVGQLLQPTRPTIQVPNQMIRMYPMRNDYMDDQIASFPLIIVSHRLGQAFSIKPYGRQLGAEGSSGEGSSRAWTMKMTYDHDLEITRPWYYSTYLVDDDITVEYTPGKKTGIFRFQFPENAPASLLFDVYNNGNSEWKFISAREITGVETYHDDIRVYLYGRFDRDGTQGVVRENRLLPDSTFTEGKSVRAWISFPQKKGGTVEFRYAISFISPEQARRNFEEELTNTSFEDLKATARQAWAKLIGQVKVEGGTEEQKRSFYSALYRCSERMVDITEDNKYYSGFDKTIHTTDRPFYVDDWTWDTYLALHPLRAILNPAKEEDMLNSYVTMYSQSGWMPTFPVLFGDHACMNGFHSSIMFLDDYRKGLRNFDSNKAYEGMVKNATSATMLPWRNGPKTKLEDYYYSKGYYPALRIGETETNSLVNPGERRQAVAVTLAASYDDWAVAEMAKELNKEKDYTFFRKRAGNYKNLWNSKYQFFIPKDSKGDWIDIDPKFDGGKGGRDYYDENNGWTYLWQVQEDVKGLIGLMGGRDDFEARLDQLFREGLGRSKNDFWYTFPDATGLVGQYSMGNEPSFHIPYLYNYTKSPWKTQKRVRFLLDTWFKDNIFGIPGDEDGGGMSAFVVFSSMGFYPVTPGIPTYTIGSPVFEKVTIALPNGKEFKIIANHCSKINKYIQHAKFDGQDLNTPWFTHEQLVNGGRLELEMGPKPDKEWGTGPSPFNGQAEE
jgi:predicted alpha-1,2-mannosidase